MRRILILSLLAFFAMSVGVKAERLERHTGDVQNGYNFWLSVPEDTVGEKPLVIFLHGASLCGNNLDRVKRYGTIDAIEKGRKIDAFVAAPQNPGGAWNPAKIKNVLEWVKKNHNIDSKRVYVLGMSLGGYGTVDFTSRYPDEVAAAIAICGGGTSSNLSALSQVPLWIIHGTADNAVPISQSDRVVKAIEQADPKKSRLIYDKLPGVNHSKPARIFYMADIYEWLFKHSLDDENRELQATPRMTVDAMSKAYNGLNLRKK